MMLDREGRQEVNMQVYEDFWIGFMYMYGEILHVNMSYSKESKQLAQETFDFIANINCANHHDGCLTKSFFNIDDFRKAKENNPAIFEWIDQPETFIKELSNQSLSDN